MATDISQINGHGPGYDYAQSASSYNQPAAPSTQSTSTSDIPKDEVGWFFIESYYSTMATNPDKLYLFYNKRSHFVHGEETEKTPVDIGQKAISERFKKLDFQDPKVRISNVDAQGSDSNVVIQVIGEISNKSQPARRFAQTFVLAQQTNGYFVLNDIFRYLVEEEEEGAAEPAAAPVSGQQEAAHSSAGESTSQTLANTNDPAAIEKSAHLLNEQLESKAENAPAAINGTAPHADVKAVVDAPSPEPAVTPSVLEPEKPKDPSPSPAKQTPQPAAAAVAPPPSKPAAPKTWANLAAAANRTATPASTSQPAAASQASTKTTTTNAPNSSAAPSGPATAEPSQSQAQSSTQASTQEPAAADSQDDDWTSVGDHRKQQSRAQAATQEGPQSRAYIKNVHENVDPKQLRQLLERFGELQYFDVSRQKSCAFVDFKTPEGYKAAVDANPHQLGEDRIIVEERRTKPGAYPYVPRGGARGGRGGPQGAGGPRGGAGGFQNGGRGAYAGRGRGGPGAGPRGGRGGAQAS